MNRKDLDFLTNFLKKDDFKSFLEEIKVYNTEDLNEVSKEISRKYVDLLLQSAISIAAHKYHKDPVKNPDNLSIVNENLALNPDFVKVIKLLIDNGANPTVGHTKQGLNAIMMAATLDNQDILEVLFNAHNVKEIKVDQIDNAGNTAIYYAGMTNSLNSLRFLLNKGADLNYRNAFKNEATVLHSMAASSHQAFLIREDGIKIRVTENIMNAKNRVLKETIMWLINNGIDQTLKTNEGLLPEELVEQVENIEEYDLLSYIDSKEELEKEEEELKSGAMMVIIDTDAFELRQKIRQAKTYLEDFLDKRYELLGNARKKYIAENSTDNKEESKAARKVNF